MIIDDYKTVYDYFRNGDYEKDFKQCDIEKFALLVNKYIIFHNIDRFLKDDKYCINFTNITSFEYMLIKLCIKNVLVHSFEAWSKPGTILAGGEKAYNFYSYLKYLLEQHI